MFGPDGDRPGSVYETVTFFLGMARKNSLFIPIKIKYDFNSDFTKILLSKLVISFFKGMFLTYKIR